jgi:hypothetical protein
MALATPMSPSRSPDRRPNHRPSPPGSRLTLRTGGWTIALALILVTAVTLGRLHDMLGSHGSRAVGDGRNPTTYGFSLCGFTGDRGQLAAGGLPRDGIPVLDFPPSWTVARVDSLARVGRNKYLVSGDRVIGVTEDGRSRAYPLMILNWHEVVNDSLGGVPIAVTYSPLCDAAVVYRRGSATWRAAKRAGSSSTKRGRETIRAGNTDRDRAHADSAAAGQPPILLGHAGLMYNSNTLLYDRQPGHVSESLFNQLTGRAMAGPAAARGESLTVLSCVLVRWADWKTRHPETTVLWRDPARTEVYKREPYLSYFGDDRLRFPVAPLPRDNRWPRKTPCLVLGTGEGSTILPLPLLASRLDQGGAWRTNWHGQTLVFHWRDAPPTAWVETADGSDGPVVRQACWFSWFAMQNGRVEIVK